MKLVNEYRHINKNNKDYYLIDCYVLYDSGKRYRLSTIFVDRYIYYGCGGLD